MAKRMYHMGLNTAQESWRAIRSFRSDSSAMRTSALRDQRLLVFHAGLEQAQQQFAAAARIGYESRPLNLFYGLSQAGRPIAAASHLLGLDDTDNRLWLAQGHGIALSGPLPNESNFLNLSVKAKRTQKQQNTADLFSRVSIALDSPTDFGSVPLLQLLAQIPEYRFEFEDCAPWLPELHPNGIWVNDAELDPPYEYQVGLPGFNASRLLSAAEIEAIADRYPALEGWPVKVEADGSVPQQDGNVTLLVLDRKQIVQRGDYLVPRGAIAYRRSRLLFPAVGNSEHALKPLLTWWLVLYALSMVARYYPAEWTAVLAVSSSPVASKVEHILDSALDVVPDLIAGALANPHES